MITKHSILALATRLAKGSFRKEPVKLIIETTRLCNSRCKTCGIWREGQGKDLDADRLVRSLGSAAESVTWISLTGGEVTLYEPLAYLVRKLRETCRNLSMINIPLNGIDPARTTEIVEKLISENESVLFHITLSIDGIGECQDRWRGPGQWSQSVDTWARLLELKQRYRNLKVSVQTTVSQYNIHDPAGPLAVMEQYAKQSDTFIIAFAMENEFYSKREGAGFQVRHSDLEAVKELARKYPVRGPESILEKLFLLGMVRRLRRGTAGVPCVAGKQVLFVGWDGDVRPCPFFDSSMGKLEDFGEDLQRLLASPGAATVRAAARACDKCWNNCVGLPSLAFSPIRALRVVNEAFRPSTPAPPGRVELRVLPTHVATASTEKSPSAPENRRG